MLDKKQLILLCTDANQWNEWRTENYSVEVHLSGADFSDVDLKNIDLSGADLSGANFSGIDLKDINLSGANLSGANFTETFLKRTNFSQATLKGVKFNKAILNAIRFSKADLSNTEFKEAQLTAVIARHAEFEGACFRESFLVRSDFSKTHLHQADFAQATLKLVDFSNADLYQVDLQDAKLEKVKLCDACLMSANLKNADLEGSNLRDADCVGADLTNVNLTRANLTRIKLLNADCTRAELTGVCIQDWNINEYTSWQNTKAEYVFRKSSLNPKDGELEYSERCPSEGFYKPGEFATLYQKITDTVDLIFKDGIDWQAFFQSFQELRSRYADQSLSIQAIEKKRDGAFIVRLEGIEAPDKASIESDARQIYDGKLKEIESQYKEQLCLQGAHLEDIQSILEYEREERTQLLNMVEKMAEEQKASKYYDMRGAQIAGGVADNVSGAQYGGTINNYGANAEDITRLITALRDQAKTFPADHKDEALDTLNDLENDLVKSEPDQERIGRRLKKLVALASTVGALVSGAANVSSDLSTFATNVTELTETLGIPIEQVQLPPSNQP